MLPWGARYVTCSLGRSEHDHDLEVLSDVDEAVPYGRGHVDLCNHLKSRAPVHAAGLEARAGPGKRCRCG